MVSVITESNMNFIAENIFHIEKSKLYENIGEGIRSVEFVRVKDDKLLFVEAKTTFPNPDNPSVENPAKFELEIEGISEKFIHSLNLFSSIKVGVAENAFPSDFVLPKKVSLVFLLVITKHKIEWCKKIERALTAALPSYLKLIWKPEVYVVNQEIAAKRNLIVGYGNG